MHINKPANYLLRMHTSREHGRCTKEICKDRHTDELLVYDVSKRQSFKRVLQDLLGVMTQMLL